MAVMLQEQTLLVCITTFSTVQMVATLYRAFSNKLLSSMCSSADLSVHCNLQRIYETNAGVCLWNVLLVGHCKIHCPTGNALSLHELIFHTTSELFSQNCIQSVMTPQWCHVIEELASYQYSKVARSSKEQQFQQEAN